MSAKTANQYNRASVKEADLHGRRVLMRVDFNVPLAAGRVTDDTRIRATLPTIQYLREKGVPVILMSHLGRPKGRSVAELSLRPVASVLGSLLGTGVAFVPDCLGLEAEETTRALAPGEVALLENVRFYAGDEANDPGMAAALARHGDVFVNDAFGAAHRAHASTFGVAAHLPAYAGLLMERELEMLGGLLSSPARPFVVILGGAKVSDKLPVIEALLDICDVLALGGGMANTFLAATGAELGKSLVETEMLAAARDLLGKAASRGVRVILPSDLVVATSKDAGEAFVVGVEGVAPNQAAYDIGPASAAAVAGVLDGAGTIFWNGTVGVYEVPAFAAGTAAVAKAIAGATARGSISVAAGGDSLAAVSGLRLGTGFTHVSTGGGASLELLEGRVLPGVDCLLPRAGGAEGPGGRVPVMAGNWKMNKIQSEARDVVRNLEAALAAQQGNLKGEVLICPPFTALGAVACELAKIGGARIGLAAQDMHWENAGAFTGEVSAAMLVDAGCRAVIIGHSERRTLFAETDDWVNRKVAAALAAGLMPIVCVGETGEERQAGLTGEVLTRQVEASLSGLTGAEWPGRLVIAYEPVWAIGSGAAASPEDAQTAAGLIRSLLPAQAGPRVRILYGGSVKQSNVGQFMAQSDIDGVLVGGASLDGGSFGSLVIAGLSARANVV